MERAVRIGETPALEEVVDSIHRLGPLLWTHRPDSPEFLTLRVGLGDAPSRCRIEMPSDNDADPKYLAQLSDLRDEFAVVRDVPLVADLRECGALGVCGPRAVVDGVARKSLATAVRIAVEADCSEAVWLICEPVASRPKMATPTTASNATPAPLSEIRPPAVLG